PSSPMVIEDETQLNDSMEVQFRDDKSIQNNLFNEKNEKVHNHKYELSFIESLSKWVLRVCRKCQNFNPAQSGTHKDKPALRHQNAPLVISWDGLPFVDKPLVLENDIREQCEM
ncbi:18334_t:CDS:2, partial [Racocetra fulgida]